jgi:multiple antibiotic resistance protein
MVCCNVFAIKLELSRPEMAHRACIVACLVLVAFSVTGLTILGFFGITVPAFKIAGGILLLRASLEMLQGSRATRITSGEREEGY